MKEQLDDFVGAVEANVVAVVLVAAEGDRHLKVQILFKQNSSF